MVDTQFNTHPQPRTFAPSKEDVLQNLMYFFGAPVSPEKLKDYSEHHAMTCARRPAPRVPRHPLRARPGSTPPRGSRPRRPSPSRRSRVGAQTIFLTRMLGKTPRSAIRSTT